MEITHDLIIEECCKAFGVTVKETISSSRKNLCVLARQLAFKIIKEELDYSYVKIGEILGTGKKPRHHSTVMYGITSIESYIHINDYIAVNAYKKVINKIHKKHEGYEKITIYHKPGFDVEVFMESILEKYPNVMMLKE